MPSLEKDPDAVLEEAAEEFSPLDNMHVNVDMLISTFHKDFGIVVLDISISWKIWMGNSGRLGQSNKDFNSTPNFVQWKTFTNKWSVLIVNPAISVLNISPYQLKRDVRSKILQIGSALKV